MNFGGQYPRPKIASPMDLLQRMFNALRNVVQIGRAASPVLAIPLAAITATTTTSTITEADTGNPSPIYVDWCTELAIDVSVTAVAGTTPTYTLNIDRLGADGVWYPIYAGTTITAAGKQSVTLGVGASTNVGFGHTIQIREVITGTAGQSVTRSLSIIGK